MNAKAKELRDKISAWNRGEVGGSLTVLLDAALRRERNAQREVDAAKADMIAALWESRQDHSSADRCATAAAISRDIRSAIEPENPT